MVHSIAVVVAVESVVLISSSPLVLSCIVTDLLLPTVERVLRRGRSVQTGSSKHPSQSLVLKLLPPLFCSDTSSPLHVELDQS